ncbi:MAG: organomercurial lyase [Lachnospiraceae bacterium]
MKRCIYPISAHQTIHQVILEDGRKLYAICAIDALGCTYTFGQDIAGGRIFNWKDAF